VGVCEKRTDWDRGRVSRSLIFSIITHGPVRKGGRRQSAERVAQGLPISVLFPFSKPPSLSPTMERWVMDPNSGKARRDNLGSSVPLGIHLGCCVCFSAPPRPFSLLLIPSFQVAHQITAPHIKPTTSYSYYDHLSTLPDPQKRCKLRGAKVAGSGNVSKL